MNGKPKPGDSIRQNKEMHERVIRDLTAQGYEIVANPTAADLPFELDGYLPDLIATKPGEKGLLVEIKTVSSGPSVDTLYEVAQIVAKHPGWGIVLHTEKDIAYTTFEDLLTPSEVRDRLTTIERTADEDDGSAFLLMWPLAESLLRRAALLTDVPVERMEMSAMMAYLYSLGVLSMDSYDLLLPLLDVRTRLIHGFRVDNAHDATVTLREVIDDLLLAEDAVLA